MEFRWENVNFHPWIGDNYEHGFDGCKLLILGESHYGEPTDNNKATIEYTEDYVDSHINHRFWTNISQILLRKSRQEISNIERKNLWHKVAFYNYIQCYVDESSKSPDRESWEKSVPMCREVFEKLSPDKVLIMGKRLWNQFHLGGEWLNEQEESDNRVWVVNIKSKPIHCFAINHPSSIGFYWGNWHDKVHEFLAS